MKLKPEVQTALTDTGRRLNTIIGTTLKIIGTILLVAVTTGSILAVIVSIYISKYLTVEMDINLNDYALKETSIVYYTDSATGETYELETLYGMQNRILAEYEEIPKFMIDALVAIEDKRFFQHNGVDWKRTIGAFVTMFGSGSTFGGSSITQQLIKNLTDEKDDTVARKIQEIVRALAFEKDHTKPEILEWYLNTCYFGQGCYGVKTAADRYFGKELSQLTVAEAASIIGITNRPTTYDPYLNPDKNKKRQEDILDQMYKQRMITEEEYDAAVEETLVFISKEATEDSPENIRSFFVDEVSRDLLNALEDKGISRAMANTLMYSGGYRIYATIDMRIQGIIDEIYQNDENFPVVKNSEKPQSSMILMDPYTGSILGMAGGRGVKTGNLVRNLATQAQRQPGSSIKPVSVYSAAMDMGVITPYSIIDDMPSENAGKNWPKNSGNSAFKGRTTVLTAVQNSINTVAVRIIETITPQKSFLFAHDVMGLNSLLDERWVTLQDGKKKKQTDIDRGPMALGGVTKGLTVKELTAAYCTFVNKGIYTEPRTFSYVTDSRGEVIIDNRPQTSIAMKEKTAYYMDVALQQVVEAGTGTKAKLGNMPTAGKTGTTSEDKDRWFIGFTPYYACGSWFGYTMPKEIKLASSTNPALTMWKLVMERAHEGLEPKEFSKPTGLVGASYCLDSGLSPTSNCSLDPRGSRVAVGTFAQEDAPKQPCNVHTLVNLDKESGQLATPYCPVENLSRVALLNLTRGLTDAVYVVDEQYVVRYWGENGPYGPALPDGKVRPIAAGADGAPAFNTFCTLHQTAAATPSSLEPPDSNIDDDTPIADLPPTPVTTPTPSPTPTPDDDFIPMD